MSGEAEQNPLFFSVSLTLAELGGGKCSSVAMPTALCFAAPLRANWPTKLRLLSVILKHRVTVFNLHLFFFFALTVVLENLNQSSYGKASFFILKILSLVWI